MTVLAVGGKQEKLVLPPPLVHFVRHPLRWVKIKVELLIAALALAHVGMFIVVALYYLLTQKDPTIKHWWDSSVQPSDLRHSIRDVSEGVLGGFLAQAIVWNHYAKSHLKAGRIFDKLHDKAHIPEVPAALLSAIIFGAIGFLILYYGLHYFHAHAGVHATTGSQWNRTQNIWKSSWDKKAMGYAAAFVARRPMHVLFDDAQQWFAERRVQLGKGTRFYHPPTFKARVNDLASQANATAMVTPLGYRVANHSRFANTAMLGSIVVGLGLAAYGYFILTQVA